MYYCFQSDMACLFYRHVGAPMSVTKGPVVLTTVFCILSGNSALHLYTYLPRGGSFGHSLVKISFQRVMSVFIRDPSVPNYRFLLVVNL